MQCPDLMCVVTMAAGFVALVSVEIHSLGTTVNAHRVIRKVMNSANLIPTPIWSVSIFNQLHAKFR